MSINVNDLMRLGRSFEGGYALPGSNGVLETIANGYGLASTLIPSPYNIGPGGAATARVAPISAA